MYSSLPSDDEYDFPDMTGMYPLLPSEEDDDVFYDTEYYCGTPYPIQEYEDINDMLGLDGPPPREVVAPAEAVVSRVENQQPVEGPLPMEVGPVDTIRTVENQQPVESPSFTWKIENFSMQNTRNLSDVFSAGGYNWRVMLFPWGDGVYDDLSMYLEVADSANLPYGWSRCAKFNLAIVSQIDDKYTVRKYAREHVFTAQQRDTGFANFMPLSVLYDHARGYLVNDTCIVQANVTVDRNLTDYFTYDSRKETGYLGLKNQGATCYMNSLLQTLYHIPYFRKAVYNMPTTEDDSPSESIPLAKQKGKNISLALQTLFYKLQFGENSVGTKDLTKSFGWDTRDSSHQHDVQELNRVLCEKLEDKMKGTVVEGTIQYLFEGHHINYIECLNVDYKSTRKESFYDLQLDVKGCRDVYASFDKYVEVERLEGDNKYQADQHGLQDAKKGVLFIDLPPVLQLQLKRFEYDFTRDAMTKINDRYEYPMQLDLDREDRKYLSADADTSVRNLYTLHGVLVHSGGGDRGHYYAFLRPTLSEQWFKLNDERVTKEDIKMALEEQYGGRETRNSAYMLVYIRESDIDKIMCNVDEKDIAEHLRIRLKKQLEEKQQKKKEKEHKKKEEAEAHLYVTIKVARDEDLSEQIGRNIYFGLVDHDKVRSFRIKKQMPFNLFKEEVAKEFGVPVQFQQFWLWSNQTCRPRWPLTLQQESRSVGQLIEFSYMAHCVELKLFLDIVELGPEIHPIPPPDKSKDNILLFFKLYDAEKQEIRYVGRLDVKGSGKPLEILTKLNEMAGFSPDEDIELYEEESFNPNVACEHIDKNLTFGASKLVNGDIICFQKPVSADSMTAYRYPDVSSFLKYIGSLTVVHFRSLKMPNEDAFCLEMSKRLTYEDVTERLAPHLALDDPTKIRFTRHGCWNQQPKPEAIKYRGARNLSEMLMESDILYYEVLDIPLPDLEGLKTLKVAFYHENDKVVHSITLPKQSTVGDMITHLKTKVELSLPDAELRLLEIWNHKIFKIFPLSVKIEKLYDQCCCLRAEEIPQEEMILGSQDRLVHVNHITKDASGCMMVQRFGEPFLLIIHEGETLGEVKLRIQKKLQVPDEDFANWKFTFMTYKDRHYLQDSDIVSSFFQGRDANGDSYLGLEHSEDNSPKSAAANQNPRRFESAVKIYN